MIQMVIGIFLGAILAVFIIALVTVAEEEHEKRK